MASHCNNSSQFSICINAISLKSNLQHHVEQVFRLTPPTHLRVLTGHMFRLFVPYPAHHPTHSKDSVFRQFACPSNILVGIHENTLLFKLKVRTLRSRSRCCRTNVHGYLYEKILRILKFVADYHPITFASCTYVPQDFLPKFQYLRSPVSFEETV